MPTSHPHAPRRTYEHRGGVGEPQGSAPAPPLRSSAFRVYGPVPRRAGWEMVRAAMRAAWVNLGARPHAGPVGIGWTWYSREKGRVSEIWPKIEALLLEVGAVDTLESSYALECRVLPEETASYLDVYLESGVSKEPSRPRWMAAPAAPRWRRRVLLD